MNWKNLNPSAYKYLGAYSLEGVDSLTLTIKDITVEEVVANGGKSDNCIICYFAEKLVGNITIKPMVLNKTNCGAIEKLFGNGDTDAWLGKKITLVKAQARLQRDMVPCLRVKNELPKEFKCSICGKVIDEKTYDASVAKYGVPLCSSECKSKIENKLNENGG